MNYLHIHERIDSENYLHIHERIDRRVVCENYLHTHTPENVDRRIMIIIYMLMPALVAQLDARQTGDQEVVGSTPTGLATFFHGD